MFVFRCICINIFYTYIYIYIPAVLVHQGAWANTGFGGFGAQEGVGYTYICREREREIDILDVLLGTSCLLWRVRHCLNSVIQSIECLTRIACQALILHAQRPPGVRGPVDLFRRFRCTTGSLKPGSSRKMRVKIMCKVASGFWRFGCTRGPGPMQVSEVLVHNGTWAKTGFGGFGVHEGLGPGKFRWCWCTKGPLRPGSSRKMRTKIMCKVASAFWRFWCTRGPGPMQISTVLVHNVAWAEGLGGFGAHE